MKYIYTYKRRRDYTLKTWTRINHWGHQQATTTRRRGSHTPLRIRQELKYSTNIASAKRRRYMIKVSLPRGQACMKTE
jgi:hypothetical protein